VKLKYQVLIIFMDVNMALRGFVYKRVINAIGLNDPLVNQVMSITSIAYRGLADILAIILIYSIVMATLEQL